MKRLLLGLLLATTPFVHAATVESEASWTAPTKYTDDTPLPATDIVEYRVYYTVDGNVNTDAESAHVKVTAGTSQTISINLTPRATAYTVRFGVRVLAKNGKVSALSNIASATYLVKSDATPSAPTSVKFTLSCTSGCTITPVTAP